MPKQNNFKDPKHMTHLVDYFPTISAFEIPDTQEWYFCLELLEDNGNVYTIQGFKLFQSYHDALMEGYGVIESLGFVRCSKKEKSKFSVFKWDVFNNTYIEESIEFDGFDFFVNQFEGLVAYHKCHEKSNNTDNRKG